jgi:hypothetical protein
VVEQLGLGDEEVLHGEASLEVDHAPSSTKSSQRR